MKARLPTLGLGLCGLALANILPTLPAAEKSDSPYAGLGDRINARMVDGAAVTEGTIRVRRRHE